LGVDQFRIYFPDLAHENGLIAKRYHALRRVLYALEGTKN
jgi:hypothetical protein